MKALTGLTRSAFHALIPAFGQALYDKALHRTPPRSTAPAPPRWGRSGEVEDGRSQNVGARP